MSVIIRPELCGFSAFWVYSMDSEETLRATLKQYELEKVQITQLVLDAKDLAVKV